MDEVGVRRVLLVRAFEEERGGRRFLEPAECAAATREARVEAGEDLERFLKLRADRLYASLREALPGLDSGFDATALRGPQVGWVFVLAMLVGLAVDRAGGGRFLNLLAFPLIGMIAWNLVVYIALVVGAMRGGDKHRALASTRGWLLGPAAWLAAPERPWSRWRRVADAAGAAAHGHDFFSAWSTAGAPLLGARLKRVLHFGAAGLVLGAVCGMYIRGLALEYSVGWESTFFDAERVHLFLSIVLAPALAAGIGQLPDVEALRLLEGAPDSGSAGEAASWIHLYAFTALALVLVPRMLLAFQAGYKSRKLERELPVSWDTDPWALRLFARDRGGAVEVRTLVYAYRMSARSSEGLLSFMLDLFGNRASISERENFDYGDEYPVRASERDECCELFVFNLAQTPEREVHAEFCGAGLAQASSSPGRRAVLVIVDEASYAERLGSDEEGLERLEARRRNWSRVLRELDLEAVFLDLSVHVSNEALGRARGALWPAPLEVL